MTDAEFRATWDIIAALARSAQVISIEDTQKLIELVGYAHTVGPIVDPTAYRAGAHNLDDQATLAIGFLAFRKAIEQVKGNQ